MSDAKTCGKETSEIMLADNEQAKALSPIYTQILNTKGWHAIDGVQSFATRHCQLKTDSLKQFQGFLNPFGTFKPDRRLTLRPILDKNNQMLPPHSHNAPNQDEVTTLLYSKLSEYCK